MSRRKLTAVVALAGAALAAAGVAAAGHMRAQTTQQAQATFAATSVTRSNARSCTASDGAYTETTATYTGTATSSDARLAGPLVIRAHSVVDTTSGIGWLDGNFRIQGGDGNGNASGTLHAAISGGNAVGAVVGRTSRNAGKLIASLASAFTADGGFLSGSLGTGSVAGAGVVFERGSCTNAKRERSVSVSRLGFSTHEVVPAVSGKGRGTGSFTLDVTRDSTGAISSAKAVFYVNYRFGAPETLTGLALHQGARRAEGPVVLDSGAGSLTDADGNGNLTEVVNSVSADLAQALLANPRGYYVELTAADTALRAQLGGFKRR